MSSLPSSLETGGDTNPTVGRDPEADGPLDFFRIGWGGGGREEDGVGNLPPELDVLDEFPDSSCDGCLGARLRLAVSFSFVSGAR